MEDVPLLKEEVLAKGYKWQENLQRTSGKETLSPENIPESIKDTKDSIINEILVCIDCKRNYKITRDELTFYRKMEIPLPRRCFYCRNDTRLKRINPFKLWHRHCMCNKENHFHGEGKCEVEFETSYAPDRPEIVYCEKCYQQEVY
jgi:hypothetical protein